MKGYLWSPALPDAPRHSPFAVRCCNGCPSYLCSNLVTDQSPWKGHFLVCTEEGRERISTLPFPSAHRYILTGPINCPVVPIVCSAVVSWPFFPLRFVGIIIERSLFMTITTTDNRGRWPRNDCSMNRRYCA